MSNLIHHLEPVNKRIIESLYEMNGKSINSKYRNAAKLYHPNKGGSNANFQRLREIYELAKNRSRNQLIEKLLTNKGLNIIKLREMNTTPTRLFGDMNLGPSRSSRHVKIRTNAPKPQTAQAKRNNNALKQALKNAHATEQAAFNKVNLNVNPVHIPIYGLRTIYHGVSLAPQSFTTRLMEYVGGKRHPHPNNRSLSPPPRPRTAR